MDRKETEHQCAICGETVEQDTEKSEWLCFDCADSWERELGTSW
ncbi:hypothetical protein [Alicyclobacillus fastidiosus]|uniref:Uncharacterized protein n=2 Tax=Alicyclobacillus fastidiosus TaxID=392011 RepID=A0ABV5ADJ0_9BACL|nr:hypothetical protein [Alicyclobacillus fastidiosus]WAH40896.1 hypothetical protein NZD89_21790 [Alicyclobacillus fastidiosus]WEH08676.1 hypothetical protein PYS47_18595 [Alicyclobacillus fastidiosus]GMA62388.1 hypothetical protein GCM10025859_28280 [Alicyclobacillus fastidiosus]